jgi:hypothetical protein
MTAAPMAVVPNAANFYGDGGLFSQLGVEKPVISALNIKLSAYGASLPARGTQFDNPIYNALTGFTEGTPTPGPADPCTLPPPCAGAIGNCLMMFPLGRYSCSSAIIDVDSLGKRPNRAYINDYTIIGGGNQNSSAPLSPATSLQSAFRNEMAYNLFNMAMGWAMRMSKQVWTGNPTNNNVGGGYKEFKGLELLVNTGYTDAITPANTCPELDSLILTGTFVDGDLVAQLIDAFHQLNTRANETGLAPVVWDIVMRSEMWHLLASIWPCTYAMTACGTSFANNQLLFTEDLAAARDRLYQSRSLPIEGTSYRVIIDDTLPVTGTGITATSDIYILPRSVIGGFGVTFWEYFDYSAPGNTISQLSGVAGIGDVFTASDGGAFLWSRQAPQAYCIQMVAKTEPRIVFLTPFLAAKVNNITHDTPAPIPAVQGTSSSSREGSSRTSRSSSSSSEGEGGS